MFRKWFDSSHEGEDGIGQPSPRNGFDSQAPAASEPAGRGETPAASSNPAGSASAVPPAPVSFERIYADAAIEERRGGYGVFKLGDMVSSAHLAGMSAEAKHCAVLMALEAAGAKVEDLLQDAVARKRALNDYEDMLLEKLRRFEDSKAAENAQIQAELDRISHEHMARIQDNLDQVARAQDDLRAWQRRKQQEAQRITDAAKFCVPQDAGLHDTTLVAVLERASASAR